MSDIASCDIFYVDEKKVKSVEKKLERNKHYFQLTEVFKLLSDPTRLKIILALKEEELCVCDLATLLRVSRSAISHQLRPLKNLRLVKYRRDGKITYYSLADTHISDLLTVAIEHIQE